MCYTEKTGKKGYNEIIYAIQDISNLELQMLQEGLTLLRETLVNSENLERYKLVLQLDSLNRSLQNIEL